MKQNGYVKAVKAAFPYTIPVLTGYLFIGIAFGVMYQEKGYNFLWAILMSILVYAGSGQYLAVNFFAPGVSFLQIIFLEFMVNIRHVFYGLSLIEKFRDMGKKKLYMIFSLTDETYSLFFITKVPEGVDEHKFLFSIALYFPNVFLPFFFLSSAFFFTFFHESMVLYRYPKLPEAYFEINNLGNCCNRPGKCIQKI